MFKYFDLSNHRIGDKIAACGQLSFYKQKENLDLIILDPTFHSYFPCRFFFSDLYDQQIIENEDTKQIKKLELELSNNYETFSFHNLWISTPSLKLDYGYVPKMYLPNYLKKYQNTLGLTDGRKLIDFKVKVGLHCLTDAPYNVGRNHNPEQWQMLTDMLSGYIMNNNLDDDVIILEIPNKKSNLPVQNCMAIVEMCDIYVGGDTGFTHAFAGFHNDNPLIAIYGTNKHDVDAFRWEKEKYGYSSDWCSDPLSFNMVKYEMDNHQFNIEEVYNKIIEYINQRLNG